MILVKPSYQIQGTVDGSEILSAIERAGRTCYKSEDRITDTSARDFVAMLVKRGHESVLEHEKVTVRFICDRGVSHEIVRHRIASFSQESTRYCDYAGSVAFIIPPWVNIEPGEYDPSEFTTAADQGSDRLWFVSMAGADGDYEALRNKGWRPEQARSVLPNSLKTEIVVTANLREWRTIFKQRTAAAAHPQMRELMVPLLAEMKERIPVVFDDIEAA